jgi:hypothetical protein
LAAKEEREAWDGYWGAETSKVLICVRVFVCVCACVCVRVYAVCVCVCGVTRVIVCVLCVRTQVQSKTRSSREAVLNYRKKGIFVSFESFDKLRSCICIPCIATITIKHSPNQYALEQQGRTIRCGLKILLVLPTYTQHYMQ